MSASSDPKIIRLFIFADISLFIITIHPMSTVQKKHVLTRFCYSTVNINFKLKLRSAASVRVFHIICQTKDNVWIIFFLAVVDR